MARQVVFGEIGVERIARPVGKRIELQPARAPVELEARQALARRRLESLASGDGGVEISESVFERLDLANLAATVGVVGPAQPGFVLRRPFPQIGRATGRVRVCPYGYNS